MNKERNTNLNNAIVVFDGDVKSSELNELFDDFQGDIIINGDLILDCNGLKIKCDNLYVNGSVSVMDNADLILNGNLYVEKDIDCYNISINGSISCERFMDSRKIVVAEDLYVKFTIDTNDEDILVGGELICESVTAAEITVLKRIEVSVHVEASGICVG